MAPGPAAAVYEEYLESNMRTMLEALVEALLRSQPKDVADFSAKWLIQWHKDQDPEREEVERLTAERDKCLLMRDELKQTLAQLEAQSHSAKMRYGEFKFREALSSHEAVAAMVGGGSTMPEMIRSLRELLRLLLPLVGTQLLSVGADRWTLTFVGHYDYKNRAHFDGAGIGKMYSNITGLSLGVSATIGLATFCAQAYGSGRSTELNPIYIRRALILLFMCFTFAFLAAAFCEPLLNALGQPPEVAHTSARYAQVQLIGVPFWWVSNACHLTLSAAKITFPGNLVSAPMQVTLCYIFLSPHWLNLGYLGNAMARALGGMISLTVMCITIKARGLQKLVWQRQEGSENVFKAGAMKAYLTVSIPAALVVWSEWWAFEVLSLLVGRTPDAEVNLAAHGTMFNVITVFYMCWTGASMGLCTLVGNALGANDKARIPPLLRMSFLFSLVTSVAVALGYEGLKPGILGNFIGYWVVGLPLGALLGCVWGWPSPLLGVWLGNVAALFIAASWVLTAVFCRIDWLTVERVDAVAGRLLESQSRSMTFTKKGRWHDRIAPRVLSEGHQWPMRRCRRSGAVLSESLSIGVSLARKLLHFGSESPGNLSANPYPVSSFFGPAILPRAVLVEGMLPVPKLSPLKSFCCSCSVNTGTGFIIILHFLACVAVIANIVIHFLFHKETYGSKVWPPEALLGLTMFMLMGLPITVIGYMGVWQKWEPYVRVYLVYLLTTFVGAGPGGRTYARKVAPVPGARLVASSCSAQVLKFWPAEPNRHLLRLILDSAQVFQAFVYGSRGYVLIGSDFPAPAALHGLAQAASDVTSALSDGAIRRELDWSKLTSVLALLRGVLCKPLALAKPADTRHLCAVALEAFLYTTPRPWPGMEAGSPWQEVVRFEWCCGQDVAWSESHRGLVLDTPGSLVPWGEGDGPIALFAASLEQWLPQEDFEEVYEVETMISSSAPSATASLRDWELLQFKKLADSRETQL
eukprot:s3313_g1.t1